MDDLFALRFRSFRVKSPRDKEYRPDPEESREGFRGIFSETLTARVLIHELH
jgi:hypothetical protein